MSRQGIERTVKKWKHCKNYIILEVVGGLDTVLSLSLNTLIRRLRKSQLEFIVGKMWKEGLENLSLEGQIFQDKEDIFYPRIRNRYLKILWHICNDVWEKLTCTGYIECKKDCGILRLICMKIGVNMGPDQGIRMKLKELYIAKR